MFRSAKLFRIISQLVLQYIILQVRHYDWLEEINIVITHLCLENGTQIQIGNGTAVDFSKFQILRLGPQISAAFTVPILGSQIIGFINPIGEFAYVTPCTLNMAVDPKPCFETLPAGGWPLQFHTIISYPAGNCRRKVRLRFPQFRGLK